MKRFSIVLTAFAVLALASGNALAAGDAAAGKAKSAVCAACHGADGNSTNPEWPKLAGQGAPYMVKQLEDMKAGKTRKNPLMAGIVASLSKQDMENLAAYFSSQTMTIGEANPKLVAQGERLYRGGNSATGVPACMACHGPAGKGNSLARFPRLAGQHAKYTVTQLHNFAKGARANDPNGMMRDIASRMSEDEITAVASYIQGLH